LRHKELPKGIIDHCDRNPLNNHPDNLRDVGKMENARNTKIRCDNTSGRKGVSRCGDGWRAYITVRGKQRHLGCFATKEEAAIARSAAEETLGFFGT
jgi:hypothetical protein